MTTREIFLFIILSSVLGIIVGTTTAYHADGLPMKPFCDKECPSGNYDVQQIDSSLNNIIKHCGMNMTWITLS